MPEARTIAIGFYSIHMNLWVINVEDLSRKNKGGMLTGLCFSPWHTEDFRHILVVARNPQ
jgi:hypothetical protein